MKNDAVQAIEKLVHSVADSAARGKVKTSEKIEALRVLASYYVVLKKQKVHATANEPDEVTIGNLQDAVRDIEEGNGRTVPHHQRRRRTEEAAVED
jgi:hypothetical protein